MRWNMRRWLTALRMKSSAIFRSVCREDTGASTDHVGTAALGCPPGAARGGSCMQRTISHGVFLPRFHVLAQDGVHRALISTAMLAKERQHIGIDAQCDLLLRSRPEDGVCKKVRLNLWNIGIIDVLVPHGVNALPIRSGLPFPILRFT